MGAVLYLTRAEDSLSASKYRSQSRKATLGVAFSLIQTRIHQLLGNARLSDNYRRISMQTKLKTQLSSINTFKLISKCEAYGQI